MRRFGQLGFFLAALQLCVPLYANVGASERETVLTAFRAHCDKLSFLSSAHTMSLRSPPLKGVRYDA